MRDYQALMAELVTEIDEVDVQHGKIVLLLAQLEQTVNRTPLGMKPDFVAVASVLHDLREYIREHFATEETLMAGCNYPDLEAHRSEHRFFSDRVGKFVDQFNREGSGVAGDILFFIKGWIGTHIKNTDQKYVPFLKDRYR
ncbi:MAG: bacteriohemerythrin [Negativicutes bacterium]|nr:bacteriohemerythrin [Negativicutes bacterium]